MRTILLVALALMIVGIAVYMVNYVHVAAAEAEESARHFKSEHDCAARVEQVAKFMLEKERPSAEANRVTGSNSHYNSLLHTCFVEVTVFKRSDVPVFVTTLINSSNNSAVLWTIKGREEIAASRCFGADTKPVQCDQAETVWKRYMKD
jgi:hypothetical protein